MKYSIYLFALMIFWSGARADEYRSKANEGYDYYKNGEYDKAADYYRQAGILKPDKALPKFGRGAALYKSNDFDQAGKEFSAAVGKGTAKANADAYFNAGNAFYRAGHYDEAVKSYVDALKIDSSDKDYKHNLEMALRRLEEQQKQNQNDKNKDNQDKDQKDKNQQSKDQQKQDQEKDEQGKQDQQQKQNQQQADKNQDQQKMQQAQAGKQTMTKEEAKNLLARFEQDEKEIQKRLKQVNIRGGSSHDW